MMFRSLFIAFLAATFLFLGAAPSAYAQAPAVQKAFEEVRTKLDDLVSAKDEDIADDLALRIQAFKKVLEFSAEETRTLKVRMLAAELDGADGKMLAAWKARMEEQLAAADGHYEEVLGMLTATTTSPLDLATVKTIATAFKEWRDTSFTPLATEVEEFLLVAGQNRALEVARSRFSKIENDVARLERAKIRGVATLSTLLAEAREGLTSATEAYERAYALFDLRITFSPSSGTEEILEDTATSTEMSPSPSTATSTTPLAQGTSTEPLAVTPLPTIREEIRTSLENVKKAYLAFIQMSVEVKKILK